MARLTYAYGVDVRRSRWLASTNIGNSVVRAVDRRWPDLASRLEHETLAPANSTLPISLLDEINGVVATLRSPRPSIRVLKAGLEEPWPMVTALGPAHGDVHWLLLDLTAIMALEPAHRAFALGYGLGHLQCDHGVYIAAHRLAHEAAGLSVRLVRTALGPWSKVMPFSADRAGLLACGDLETAKISLAILRDAEQRVPWLPPPPDDSYRDRALDEFARSVVFAREIARREHEAEVSVPDDETPFDPPVPDDAWSLARCDTRLTERLRIL